jgi:glycosyltransferase involved in cell wall biosynthesis
MRVLFANRDPKKWVGGDALQVERTMEALNRLGIETEFTSRGDNPLDKYDLVHIFHINFYWTKEMYENCISKNKPYVISAIFFPQVFDVPKHEMFKFAVNAKKIICLSEKEKDEMISLLGVAPDKFVVIPNGVDKNIFKKGKEKRDGFVLSVGRLGEPMKGADLGLEACKKARLKYVYVGESKDTDHAKELKTQLEHYEYLSPQELASLYRRASVYLCPSLSERQSLAVLEAAACGCPIVDSIHNRGNTLLPSSIITDPQDIDQTSKALKDQLNKINNDKVPSWDDVAKQILNEYTKIL